MPRMLTAQTVFRKCSTSTYAYRIGLGNGEISFATAIGMSQSIVSIVLLFTVNKLAKKLTGNSVI